MKKKPQNSALKKSLRVSGSSSLIQESKETVSPGPQNRFKKTNAIDTDSLVNEVYQDELLEMSEQAEAKSGFNPLALQRNTSINELTDYRQNNGGDSSFQHRSVSNLGVSSSIELQRLKMNNTDLSIQQSNLNRVESGEQSLRDLGYLQAEERKQQLVIKVKKNQLDLTAGLMYALGVSLVHLAFLIVVVFIVKWPDPSVAKELDKEFDENYATISATPGFEQYRPFVEAVKDYNCEHRAKAEYHFFELLVISHLVCFCVNAYREIFETKLGTLGQLMRLLEVLAMALYFGQMIDSAQIQLEHYRISKYSETYILPEFSRKCFTDRKVFREWSGGSFEISVLEIVVWATFMLTMPLLLIKSRCFKVGIDQTYQFSGTYTRYMVNRLIQAFVATYEDKFEYPQLFIGRVKAVEVDDCRLKIKLTDEAFAKIISTLDSGEGKDFVTEEESVTWLEENVQGEIKTADLYKQREKELNSLDMMQNTGFLYHPESLLEMQIMTQICVMTYSGANLNSFDLKDGTTQICLGLLTEHIFSIGCLYFKDWDIKHNGKFDINGIKRATKESFLSNVQFFIVCIIIGFTINHLATLPTDEFEENTLMVYWICIECFLMFARQNYISIGLHAKVSGEVTKNIYTLFFLQQKLLRTKQMKAGEEPEKEAPEEVSSLVEEAAIIKKTPKTKDPSASAPVKEAKTSSRGNGSKPKRKNSRRSSVKKGLVKKSTADIDEEIKEERRIENDDYFMLDDFKNLNNHSEDSDYSFEDHVSRSSKSKQLKKKQKKLGIETTLTVEQLDSQELPIRAGSQPKQRKPQKPATIFGTEDTMLQGDNNMSIEDPVPPAPEKKQVKSLLKMAESPSASSSSSDDEPVVKFVSPKKRKSLLKTRKPPSPVMARQSSLLAEEVNEEVLMEEDDFHQDEIVTVSKDIYQLTIAANMTKNCSPIALNFCIKQCTFVFILQLLISYLFTLDFLDMDAFEAFQTYKTSLRILVPILLQLNLHKELTKAMKMLTFLKRQKGNSDNMKGRLMNITFCFMQMTVPMVIQCSLILAITQEAALSQITKAFVTLGFIIGIDDMFSDNVPSEIVENSLKLNKSELLKLSKDYNTTGRVFHRMKKNCNAFWFCKKRKRNICIVVGQELLNLCVNLAYTIVNNIQIVFYNYFIGILCLGVQFAGYFDNLKDNYYNFKPQL